MWSTTIRANYVPSRASRSSNNNYSAEKTERRATEKRKLTFQVGHGEAKAVYPGGGALGGGSPPPGHHRRRHRHVVQALRTDTATFR